MLSTYILHYILCFTYLLKKWDGGGLTLAGSKT